MKVGTPGFQGARLKQARIALGLTQESLALMLGYKDAQSVSAMENGKDSPSPEVMQRILSLTRHPMHFFVTPLPEGIDESEALFRSMRSLDEIAKGRAEVNLSWLAEYAQYLSKFVDFPKLNIPDFSDFPRDPMLITDEQIRLAADRLRSHWGLHRGPLPNLINLLESNGFIIHGEPFESHKWDAISFWDKATNTPFILLNLDKPSYFRLRYNLLHELFHLLFHIYADRDMRDVKAYERELERQAHLFAGEFALPHDSFPADLFADNLDALRIVKSKWKMSIAAMLHRLEDLGILDKTKSAKMWANLKRRWRDSEPLDDHPLEEPTIINSTVKMLKQHNVITPHSLLSDSVFPQETQERFAKMGDEFWLADAPALKIHKLY